MNRSAAQTWAVVYTDGPVVYLHSQWEAMRYVEKFTPLKRKALTYWMVAGATALDYVVQNSKGKEVNRVRVHRARKSGRDLYRRADGTTIRR